MAALLTRMRDRLNESSARHWTDPQLRRWIMEGATDVARQTESLLATSTVSVTAATSQYSLSSVSPQPLRIHRVEYNVTGSTDKYPLEYRDFSSMDDVWGISQSTRPGTPQYWTTFGFFPSMTLTVYPVPNQAGTLRLFYYRLPTAVLDDGTQDAYTVDAPSGFEDVILDYAEARALRQDNNDYWKDAKSLYDEKLATMIKLTTRGSDLGGLITTDTGGYIPAWLVAGDY